MSARVRLSIVTIRYRTRLFSIVTIRYRTRLSSSPCSRARINGCMLSRVDKGNKAYSQRNAYLQRYLLTARGMFLEDNYGNKCAPVFSVITLTIFRRVTLFCRHFFAVRVSLVPKKNIKKWTHSKKERREEKEKEKKKREKKRRIKAYSTA